MKILFLLFTLLSIFFLSGCSTKKVFEPKEVKAAWAHYGESNETVADISSAVALLENSKVLSKDKPLDVTVKKDYRLIGHSDGWVISASIDGNLTLSFVADSSLQENFELKKTIAAASVKDDVLAVLFRDNEMALYSVSTKELLLKEQGNASIVVDSRIVNPYFMNDLVLFLTLDGKVVIVNSKLKKKLRTIIVSSEEYFNNVIYFNVIDGKLIAATAHKILSLASKEIRVNYEARNIAYDDKTIYIATKQGEVVSLTPDLQVNAKVKFPFAHFLGMIVHNEKLFILEKEGYLIEVTKDLLNYSVYKVDIKDGYIFVADKKFYIDDAYISVE
ncbi:hypothetical protein KJ877_03950 [bacterium]|nr:hypothetical protein [bacterium]MBU1989148.1 hypothetical protein [bacterium]